jgi:hypothetical protein
LFSFTKIRVLPKWSKTFLYFFFPSQNLGYSQMVQNIFSIFFSFTKFRVFPKWSKTFLYFFFPSQNLGYSQMVQKNFSLFFCSFTKFGVFGKQKFYLKKNFNIL